MGLPNYNEFFKNKLEILHIKNLKRVLHIRYMDLLPGRVYNIVLLNTVLLVSKHRIKVF